MVEVFARRRNAAHSAALVAKLEAEGRAARSNDSKFFDARQIDRKVVMVYHDGEDRRVTDTYDALGIPCELIPGFEPEGGVPIPAPVSASPGAGTSREVRQRGRWWTAYENGEKVGKSQLSESEAWALFEGA